jgi:hypothetical protein
MRHRQYRPFKVLVDLAIAAAGITLGRCTEIGEDGGYLGGTSSEAGPADPTTGVSEEPSGTTKPPESTLTLGKQTKTGVLGSYCWESVSDATETVCRCAEAASIPVPPEDRALIVPSDWVLVFDYGGKRGSASVDVGAYPLDRGKSPP